MLRQSYPLTNHTGKGKADFHETRMSTGSLTTEKDVYYFPSPQQPSSSSSTSFLRSNPWRNAQRSSSSSSPSLISPQGLNSPDPCSKFHEGPTSQTESLMTSPVRLGTNELGSPQTPITPYSFADDGYDEFSVNMSPLPLHEGDEASPQKLKVTSESSSLSTTSASSSFYSAKMDILHAGSKKFESKNVNEMSNIFANSKVNGNSRRPPKSPATMVMPLISGSNVTLASPDFLSKYYEGPLVTQSQCIESPDPFSKYHHSSSSPSSSSMPYDKSTSYASSPSSPSFLSPSSRRCRSSPLASAYMSPQVNSSIPSDSNPVINAWCCKGDENVMFKRKSPARKPRANHNEKNINTKEESNEVDEKGQSVNLFLKLENVFSSQDDSASLNQSIKQTTVNINHPVISPTGIADFVSPPTSYFHTDMKKNVEPNSLNADFAVEVCTTSFKPTPPPRIPSNNQSSRTNPRRFFGGRVYDTIKSDIESTIIPLEQQFSGSTNHSPQEDKENRHENQQCITSSLSPTNAPRRSLRKKPILMSRFEDARKSDELEIWLVGGKDKESIPPSERIVQVRVSICSKSDGIIIGSEKKKRFRLKKKSFDKTALESIPEDDEIILDVPQWLTIFRRLKKKVNKRKKKPTQSAELSEPLELIQPLEQ